MPFLSRLPHKSHRCCEEDQIRYFSFVLVYHLRMCVNLFTLPSSSQAESHEAAQKSEKL